ncbi:MULTISPECIES: AAA family ATPase [Micromonospora]|uniref:MoxR-like ATPase n=1 Tax=Micromonospora yangpuensis TaxID=683228 RepID=A0A1C6UB84_9ACTN|nr:MoxR family ATPase [Micromonospora yangpuensis]GGL87127.1 MoxR-like ATPase [Micromonospora yangpuensis]SCL51214.1 MoxR-like ATPase [Micromonospora yangpuensis]
MTDISDTLVSVPTPVDPHASGTDLEQTLFEVKRVIVGQDRLVDRLLTALVADGHCLLEGVPGVAKTLAVQTLATAVGGTFSRIQFTPDLVPSDIVGTRIYRSSSETFDVELGPVMANLVLADEINRAPAKVQSALLEAMAEHQVSIGGRTFEVPEPFLVLATQNPIESEGVYQLPEAQRDRFLMKIVVDYPSAADELAILYRMSTHRPKARQVLDPYRLREWQRRAGQVFVHHALAEYVVRLILATRDPARFGAPEVAPLLAYGASPRATLGLVSAARAQALLRGREYVLPEDVRELAVDVLAHRLVLTFDAVADGISAESVVRRLLSAVPPPRIAPGRHEQPTGYVADSPASGSGDLASTT